MTDSPTEFDELMSYSFLRERVEALREQIASRPHRTVLWIGAGHSAYVSSYPTWRGFLDECTTLVQDNEDRDIIRRIIASGRLRLAAEHLLEILGDTLYFRIGEAFSVRKVSRKSPLSRICSTRVVTTNYDSVIEQNMPWYSVVTPHDPVERILDRDFGLIKLHGSHDKPETCVLSSSAYSKVYDREFEWYLTTLFSLNTVVFIGASMDLSEPFFTYLSTLKKHRIDIPRHFAVASVRSSRAGTGLGKRLAPFGIELLPYIPKADYSNFGEIIGKLAPSEWSTRTCTHFTDPAELKPRLRVIGELLDDQRYVAAAVFIHHMSQDTLKHGSAARDFGDVVSKFIHTVLSHPDARAILQRIESSGLSLVGIIHAASDVMDPTSSAFLRLVSAFDDLHAMDGRNYDIEKNRIQAQSKR